MSLIEEDIKQLENLLEHSHSKAKKAYYSSALTTLKSMLCDIELKEFKEKIDWELCNIVDSSFDKMTNKTYLQVTTPQYIQYINRITKNALKAYKGSNLEYQFQKKKYSFEEAKSIIFDFYNSFDRKLYPIIKESLDSEHLYIVDDGMDEFYKSDGCCFCNFQSGNTYIVIYNKGKFSIDNIDCIVHELGHSIQMHNESNKSALVYNAYFSNFSEMPSAVFEKIFLQFLMDNKIDSKDAYRTDINNLILLKGRLRCLKKSNKHIATMPFESYNDSMFNSDIPLDENSDFDLDVIANHYKYVYGMALSHYYINRYRKDPEKTKKEIYSFINCIGIMDDFNMLSNFGINMDEFAKCEYLKKEINQNVKLLKKNV